MTDVTQTAAPPSRVRDLQPLLHDLATAVAAPGLVLSPADGQLSARRAGVSGWFVDDIRLLRRAELAVEGSDLELVRADTSGTTRHEFGYVLRGLGDLQPDPTVWLERVRELGPRTLAERLRVVSTAREPVEVVLHLDVETDLAPMAEVKQGQRHPGLEPLDVGAAGTSVVRWPTGSQPGTGRAQRVWVSARGSEAAVRPDGVGFRWVLRLGPGQTAELDWQAEAGGEPRFASGAPWPAAARVGCEAPDPRLGRLLRQSLRDLEGLALRDGGDRFLAAGSPWFLTLFGRDSLWAARLLVPCDTGLALSTLRVLARRQGERVDRETEEQPGKILHEVRDPDLRHSLPPLYFGTVDATPLFVCLLADAAEWGADPAEVRALLPAARRCLEWQLVQSADSGWLRYVDLTGTGLSNQGWKDSHDSVQHADGRLAEAPIALCEVQAYAYEAAVRGAALLAAYDEAPVAGLLDWAEALRERFRRDFWVQTPEGGHVAIALDRDGGQVDAVTSNIGHVLGTGILTAAQAERVAAILVGELRSGFGVHTLTPRSPRFSPLSYHGGSVWPHDSAIAARGLAAEGLHEHAALLAADLVRAGECFGYRFPELYAGDRADDVTAPAAYPAACRPQAWSAAGAVAALVAATGVRVEDGTLVSPGATGTSLGGFRLAGLRVGGAAHAVTVGPDGSVAIDREVRPES